MEPESRPDEVDHGPDAPSQGGEPREQVPAGQASGRVRTEQRPSTSGRDGHFQELHRRGVPWTLRAASEWSWRYLVIAGAVILTLYLLVRLRLIIFPIIVALFVTALLGPAVDRVQARGMRRGPATAIVFVGGIILLASVGLLIGWAFADGFSEMADNVQEGIDDAKEWLAGPPFRLTDQDIQQFGDNLRQTISENRERIFSGALGTVSVAFEVLTGVVLTLFITFFFLYDGRRIWRWVASLFPRHSIPYVLESGQRAWTTLVGYVRGTLLIALVDGTFIALVLAVLRVPLAIPLGAFVFFGAFVPLVGATVTGAVAVLVALVTKGWVTALLVLAGIIAVQQLEGHILQPFVLGRFVRVHPLAVVLAITAGAVLGGIGGAVIAVPIVAIANAIGKYFVELAREAAAPAEDEQRSEA